MTVKTAIMPSKSAAAHDSKKYYLKFLSTENGENQLNFYSHFMLHWKRRQNISWLFQPKIQKSIDFLSQLLPYGLIFLTHFLPVSANFRLYRKKAHDIIYLRVGISWLQSDTYLRRFRKKPPFILLIFVLPPLHRPYPAGSSPRSFPWTSPRCRFW